MKESSLYRLEVAPLIILPLGRSPYFTYASLVPVPKGSLVSISFGTQTVEGVVFDCQILPGRKPSWMKFVSHVITESFLTERQHLLAEQVSREYFTPLGKTLRHFLPKKTKERVTKKQTTFGEKIPLRATKSEQIILKKLSQKEIPYFLDTSQNIDDKKLFLLIGKQALKNKKQVLLLVPEITLVFPLEARLQEYFGDHVVTLHSRLSPGAFFTTWERIRSGKASIIIATRQGLFAPFNDLGTIIVTEEQDESYKQWDMSPRYQTRVVVAMLASLYQSTHILVSGTPSTESLLLVEKKRLIPLVPITSHPPLGNTLTIINLKLERYRKNFSPLSEALAMALRDTFERGEQTLLYINRQGFNAFSVCDQCKSTFRCKECNHPLNSTKDGRFRCSACGYVTPFFPSCPTCGNISFRHIGFGTEKVEREVQKLLPQAKIFRLDSTTLCSAKGVALLYERGLGEKIDVLIGTQMALKDPPLLKLTLIAMIDADSLLLFPNFRADERLFQDLSRAVRQVKSITKTGHSGQVMIQTFHPESAFLKKVSTLGSTELLTAILTDRKELLYPPFYRFITLTCSGKSEKEVLKKASMLHSRIEGEIPHNYRIRQSGTARYLKKQNQFESDVLLRLPATDSLLPETLRALLVGESKNCLIDVDPITLK